MHNKRKSSTEAPSPYNHSPMAWNAYLKREGLSANPGPTVPRKARHRSGRAGAQPKPVMNGKCQSCGNEAKKNDRYCRRCRRTESDT